MNTTSSDAKIRGTKSRGLQAEGRESAKKRGLRERSLLREWQGLGVAGAPDPWGANILGLTRPVVLICVVLLPRWTGNPLRAETYT